ncbi:portal protein [Arthrobacter phage PeggyLeg03]|nr:portal protein [Arthrobacter phage PeggyLeg03]
MPTLQIGSPEWWVHRLHKKLVEQQKEAAFFDAYYRGDHPLPWLAPQAEEDFRRILKMSRSNYMGLVCDAQVERQMLEGFRVGDSQDADKELWRIWQANNLDSDFDQGILESAIAGQSYLLVAPNPDDAKTPLMWVEHPSQCIVEYEPGTGRNKRAAGLKVWQDDWTGRVMATLYLPGWIYKYESESKKELGPQQMRWRPRAVRGEQWPAPNPWGVPLVELPNNPRLLTGGVSELYDLTDSQDRANKTLADRLMTQDYGAFPQKWAKGWPEEEEDGTPNPEINIGRDRIIKTDSVDAGFGQFDAAPLDPYSAAKREDVKDIASRSRTPAQYLLGEMANVNGETLKASESGLIAKVRQRNRPIGEGVKDALGTVRRMAGLPPAPIECIWRDPQFRTEGELVDSLVKMATLNVPEEALWERWGATPQERDRWKQWNAERRVDQTLVALNKQDQGVV